MELNGVLKHFVILSVRSVYICVVIRVYIKITQLVRSSQGQGDIISHVYGMLMQKGCMGLLFREEHIFILLL